MGTRKRPPAVAAAIVETAGATVGTEQVWAARLLVIDGVVTTAELEGALDDRRREVRAIAALGLIWAGTPPDRAFRVLLDARDDDELLRYEIGHIADFVEPHLIAALGSDDLELRRRAAWCYPPVTHAHPDRDLGALLAASRDPDPMIRESAVAAMTHMEDYLDARIDEVVEALLAVARAGEPRAAGDAFELIASRLGSRERPAPEQTESHVAAAVTGLIAALVPGDLRTARAAGALIQMTLTATERAATLAAIEPCIEASPNSWHRAQCTELRATL